MATTSSFRRFGASSAALVRRTFKLRTVTDVAKNEQDVQDFNAVFARIDALIPQLDKNSPGYNQREELRAMIEEMRYEYELTIDSYADEEVRAEKATALTQEATDLENFLTRFTNASPAEKQKAYDDFINKDWPAFGKLWGYKLLRFTLQLAAAVAIAFGGAALVAKIYPTAVASEAFHTAQLLIEKVKIALTSTQLLAGALALGGAAVLTNMYAGKPSHGVVINHGRAVQAQIPSQTQSLLSGSSSGAVDKKPEATTGRLGGRVPVVGPMVRFADKWFFNFATPYKQLVAERAEAELDATNPKKYRVFGSRG